ncbi:MAG: hypothetical protein QM489_06285 [Candidatus Izemoplasma sp.]
MNKNIYQALLFQFLLLCAALYTIFTYNGMQVIHFFLVPLGLIISQIGFHFLTNKKLFKGVPSNMLIIIGYGTYIFLYSLFTFPNTTGFFVDYLIIGILIYIVRRVRIYQEKLNTSKAKMIFISVYVFAMFLILTWFSFSQWATEYGGI